MLCFRLDAMSPFGAIIWTQGITKHLQKLVSFYEKRKKVIMIIIIKKRASWLTVQNEKERIITSTFSVSCMPKIDPMRCDRGWLPKSLLTYLLRTGGDRVRNPKSEKG